MRALRFELKGATAFFKKPDVNAYAYFTYSHIHKVALFGLLGAILGLSGYEQQHESGATFPEFYEVFRQSKISIVPHGDRGYFAKKIQIFNNTVGYASYEGLLNVREQWLEHPHWTIYIADDGGIASSVFEKLAEFMMHFKTHYIPYLGKNDHPATIISPQWVDLSPINEFYFIDSLFPGEHILCDPEGDIKENTGNKCFFKELTPVGLRVSDNGYLFRPLISTNYEIDMDSVMEEDREMLYHDEDRVLYFL